MIRTTFNNYSQLMLTLLEEKHLACFDEDSSFYSSYQFKLEKSEDHDEAQKIRLQAGLSEAAPLESFYIEIKIEHRFTYKWQSLYFKCEEVPRQNQFGSCPLSLQNYLEFYQDPKIHHFRLTLHQNLPEEEKNEIYGDHVGKIILKSTFKGSFFRLPINIMDKDNSKLEIDCPKKTLCVITEKRPREMVICQLPLISLQEVQEVSDQFVKTGLNPSGYLVHVFSISERIESHTVVIARGRFRLKELTYDKATIKIYSRDGQEIFFMEELMHHLQIMKIMMGEVESLTIFQNIETSLEDGYRTVFYSDSTSLYRRIYRSYLYDKIKEKWIIEGMINFNRSNKHFQDVMKELIDLISEGEEITPLQDDTFSFDKVWRLKAIFFYHILSNFKNLRDYGSSSLASLIIEESRKKKITSQIMFKRLKNKYGLKNFRTIYEQQFVKSTGLNRVFYEIIDLKRENRVKIIVRQKSLVNKQFRLYNYYRIKLEQEYDLMSTVTAKIIKKNNILDKNNKKKEFSGPLAVPRILKCLPYFKGTVAVETDASEMPFELELREENIIEEKQNVTSKIRAPIRKIGDNDKSYEGFGWIMVDTAHIFPSVYKNQNVDEGVIHEKIKKRYDSEHEEIKMLNCISSRDHSANEKICRALIEKVKINITAKENCTINVKRKILQILPVFLSKATDFRLWEDLLGFLKLYEPVCHDYSEDGYNFLLSLIESIGEIEYKKQFGFYFQQFHKIMLKIMRTNNFNSQQKEQKLKKVIFNSVMKWKSCFSLEILDEVEIELKLSQGKVRASLQMLKIIFKNIYPYVKALKLNYNRVVEAIYKLMDSMLHRDCTYELFAIKFQFQVQQMDQPSQPLGFLKDMFKKLQDFREENTLKYTLALQVFKNSLYGCKKIYGLELQLKLNQNQSFFLAQYLWRELTSPLSCSHHAIRLQWIKIYRVFYFYFVPIITLRKVKNNNETKSFKQLDEEGGKEVLERLRCFYPDVKWFSGYDSRSAKELKAKIEQMNESKRKKKVEEYHFSEKNVITNFIKMHPLRSSWDELAREAIRNSILIYEDKEQKSDGKEAERYKHIQEGFKKIEQKLKRGRMPDSYSYEQLKEETVNLMAEFAEKEEKIYDIFQMVDKALQEIAHENARREAEIRDEMKIIIAYDQIPEEQEGEEEVEGEAEDEVEGEQEGQDEEAEENPVPEQDEKQERQNEEEADHENENENGYQKGQLYEADQDLQLFG